MFKKELSHYLHSPETSKPPELLVDTQNQYEFTMVGLRLAGEWYALVQDPDPSRITEIDEVINDEFDADTLDWCRLKEYRRPNDSLLIAFADGEENYKAITYERSAHTCWLLKIKPRPSSRLNRLIDRSE